MIVHMGMGMKPLHNIQMNFGRTIQISQLDPFYICSVPWRKSLLVSPWFYLISTTKCIFEQIMQRNFCCLLALKTLDKILGMKALPWKLLLKIDNCVKDNKN
jgi:hypothetical protein